MSVLEASLRSFLTDTEWNFGGGRYIDATAPSIKLTPLSRRNLSAQADSLTVKKFAHGRLAEDTSGADQTGPVNSYCVANPSCVAVFNWRGCCASVVQVGLRVFLISHDDIIRI
jgi:hypothetical protein